MSRNPKKPSGFNNISSYFLTFLIAPLVIMREIGDSVLYMGKILIYLILTTYKVFFFLLKRIIISPIYLLKKIFTLKKSVKKIKTGKGIIFSGSPSWKRLQKYFTKRKQGLGLKFKRLNPLRFYTPQLKKSLSIFWLKLKFFSLGVIIVLLSFFIYQLNNFIKNLPNPAFINSLDVSTTTKILDRKGRLLYEIYAEEDRTPIRLQEVPDIVINATIATEDNEFYIHPGFSLRGITRALIHNLSSDTLEGGSTITQQLIRSAYLTPEKTLKRKVEEVILSIWAEQIYSKNQILEMYLNQVPYGGTAWGIEAAAQNFFGKSTKDLNLSETALLAGLPAAPTKYSPYGTTNLVKSRQIEVLNRMYQGGYISDEERTKTINMPLNIKAPRAAISAPHFVMYVKNLLEQKYGPRLVESGGLRVTTTLDLDLYEIIHSIVSNQIDAIRNLNVGNGAVLVTDPESGEILTMVGSADYFDEQNEGNVNVNLSLRQPGSSIKVVNYAAALQSGFTTASILDDSPITYHFAGQTYRPVNYDGRYHGKVTLRTALASSYNVPAVKVLDKIGVDTMIAQGKKMGITSWSNQSQFGLSLTLGGGAVTMMDMARVYGVLANSGIGKDLTPLIKITDYKGNTLALPRLSKDTIAIPEGVAFILSDILADNRARTPAFGPNSSLVVPNHTISVKTGTSDNKRDNWTIGYTKDYVVTVWVGNNDNSPMDQVLTSGVTGAAPIWNEIMTFLQRDKPDTFFPVPEDIITIPCYGRREYFIIGTQPKDGCPKLVPNTPTVSEINEEESN